ncbi:MAG: DUF4301 family protein [Bacteroidota bacterium]
MHQVEDLPFLSAQDVLQLQTHGVKLEQVKEQISHFVSGFPALKLVRPVGYGDGVIKLSEETASTYFQQFEQAAERMNICKFVPASGAASRMFRLLFTYLEANRRGEKLQQAQVDRFFANLHQFAFYAPLKNALAENGLDLDKLLEKEDFLPVLECLLGEAGLNFGQLPKALIPFHRYPDHCRTAVEEHLVEGALYGCSRGNHVHVHFTVSKHHLARIKEHVENALSDLEEKFECKFHPDFSIQLPSTDTIAVDLENKPFRDEEGRLVLRPGGHGALLENLNQVQADLIFIKNVDNVVPEHLSAPTVFWKKVIGGVLITVQKQVFEWLQRMESWKTWPTEENESQAVDFIQSSLNIALSSDYAARSPKVRVDMIRDLLNRPLRVLGIIRTDEPTGGGPFWVAHPNGSQSLQIVETAQINLKDPAQKSVVSASYFANITDLVCGIRNYRGEKFDLLQYRDKEAGFIAEKSLNGRPLKALEHPGLWNGAMAYWNTILVEVPQETFNPVKSVMDLLEEGHIWGRDRANLLKIRFFQG